MVNMIVAQDAEVEAAFIADEIQSLAREGRKLAEMAVLYRSNLQSEPIESALKQRGIPLYMIGGTQRGRLPGADPCTRWLTIAESNHRVIDYRRLEVRGGHPATIDHEHRASRQPLTIVDGDTGVMLTDNHREVGTHQKRALGRAPATRPFL